MPELGEIRKGYEIRKTEYEHENKYVWHACVDCSKTSWVAFRNQAPVSLRCRSCSHKRVNLSSETLVKMSQARVGINSFTWNGGRKTHLSGYISIKLYPGDFFYSMVGKDGYVFEHRLVMAKSIGRCLHSWEIVHHENGKRNDNRVENLQLVTDDRHKQITILENKIKKLEQRLTLVEAENILLRQQLLPEYIVSLIKQECE